MSEVAPLPPQDDPEAAPNGTHVYRRINPEWWISNGDGGHRLSSQAFQDHPEYMSVAIGAVLQSMELPPEKVIDSYDGFGLARLEVTTLRQDIRLGISLIPTESEPWHGGVWGKKTGGVKNKLVTAALMLVEPRSVGQKLPASPQRPSSPTGQRLERVDGRDAA